MPNKAKTSINTISISKFNHWSAEKVFEEVKKYGVLVVTKNNTPECVLLSPNEYLKLMDDLNDTHLLGLANERMASFDESRVITESKVLKDLGINADDLANIDELDIE